METPLTPQDPTNNTSGTPTHTNPEPTPTPGVVIPVATEVATPAPVVSTPASEPTPAPVPPVHTPAQSGAGHVDLGKILLPTKEEPGHTVLSAQRINAGALLEQEIAASKDGTHAGDTLEAQVAAAKPAPAPKAAESEVRSIETYQRDIESVVQTDNLSVLSIATAEANRRSGSSLGGEEVAEPQTKGSLWRNVAMIAGGSIFLIAASGVLAYLVTRPTSVPIAVTRQPNTPYINVDATKVITITPDETRTSVMSKINAARQATSVSLGLMAQLLVTESSSTQNGEVLKNIPAQDLFTILSPNIPPSLARTFLPAYILGVHEYNGEQPFILVKVYSYETAYAGMLAWEPYMRQELSPLFSYVPTQRITDKPPTNASSTVTPLAQPVQTGFVDIIIENHDSRALVNSSNDVYLLWTFLDRNTLVITTNDATLREVVSRLKEAPITPIPAGN